MSGSGRLDTYDGWWAWRDDLYERAGSRGGKVRTCWQLAQTGQPLVTAGARHSPQVGIVAGIAAALGVPCRVHVPDGATTPEIAAAERHGKSGGVRKGRLKKGQLFRCSPHP